MNMNTDPHIHFSPQSLNRISTERLALGVFDGVHVAHQQVLASATTGLTFTPHPDMVLGKKTITYLTTLPEQRHFFPSLLSLRFNRSIANLTWSEFLDQVLMRYLKPDIIITGYDYKFGKKQEGTIEKLSAWARPHNIQIETIAPVYHNDTLIKSTRIRSLLEDGQFQLAHKMLGHDYPIFGKVVSGDGRGKTLGFPTANVSTPKHKCLPQNGVYGGYWLYRSKQIPCIIYIGTKPTFTDASPQVEVHIPNFSGNLYGKTLKCFISKKIRGEQTFQSKNALITQIRYDLQQL